MAKRSAETEHTTEPETETKTAAAPQPEKIESAAPLTLRSQQSPGYDPLAIVMWSAHFGNGGLR